MENKKDTKAIKDTKGGSNTEKVEISKLSEKEMEGVSGGMGMRINIP